MSTNRCVTLESLYFSSLSMFLMCVCVCVYNFCTHISQPSFSAYLCILLYVYANLCIFPHTFHKLMHISVYFRIFLHTSAHFRTLSHVSAYFCIILPHIYAYLSTFVHTRQVCNSNDCRTCFKATSIWTLIHKCCTRKEDYSWECY